MPWVIYALTRLLLLAAAVALLRYLPVTELETFSVLLLASVLALPVAVHLAQYRLFARRALLEAALQPGSHARSWFWYGGLIRIGSFIIAFCLALLLILMLASFGSLDWMLTMAAAAALVVVDTASYAILQHEANPRSTPLIQRSAGKWIVIPSIVALAAFANFNKGYPVYIDQDPVVIMERAYTLEVKRFASPLLAHISAALAAGNAGTVYLAQNYIPRFEADAVKWLLWIYFSLKTAIAATLLVYLMLGLLALLSIKQQRGWSVLGRTLFEKSFTLTLLILFALFLYASRLTMTPLTRIPTTQTSPCEASGAALAAAAEQRTRQLDADEARLQQSIATRLDVELERIFTRAEGGVDDYLDWYFSVLGEYQRLGMAAIGRLNADTNNRLQQHFLQSINDQVATLTTQLDRQVLTGLNSAAAASGIDLQRKYELADCMEKLDFEPLVFAAETTYVGKPQALVTGGAIAAVSVKKVAAKFGAKTAGKAAGKWGAALGTGAVAASACGPLAPVCGIGAALVTWVLVDTAITGADELLNRDALRSEILAELARQRESIQGQLNNVYGNEILHGYDRIKQQFLIPVDGGITRH